MSFSVADPFDRHGLSYTKFSFSNLIISPISSHDADFDIDISVTVANAGSVSGSEVVQVYITNPETGLTTPKLQLRGFAKIKDLPPGASQTVTIHLDKYAVSYWDVTQDAWKADAGLYRVLVGRSSYDIVLEGKFEVKNSFGWVGL